MDAADSSWEKSACHLPSDDDEEYAVLASGAARRTTLAADPDFDTYNEICLDGSKRQQLNETANCVIVLSCSLQPPTSSPHGAPDG